MLKENKYRANLENKARDTNINFRSRATISKYSELKVFFFHRTGANYLFMQTDFVMFPYFTLCFKYFSQKQTDFLVLSYFPRNHKISELFCGF